MVGGRPGSIVVTNVTVLVHVTPLVQFLSNFDRQHFQFLVTVLYDVDVVVGVMIHVHSFVVVTVLLQETVDGFNAIDGVLQHFVVL